MVDISVDQYIEIISQARLFDIELVIEFRKEALRRPISRLHDQFEKPTGTRRVVLAATFPRVETEES
jgi:hypothetical protein